MNIQIFVMLSFLLALKGNSSREKRERLRERKKKALKSQLMFCLAYPCFLEDVKGKPL